MSVGSAQLKQQLSTAVFRDERDRLGALRLLAYELDIKRDKSLFGTETATVPCSDSVAPTVLYCSLKPTFLLCYWEGKNEKSELKLFCQGPVCQQ